MQSYSVSVPCKTYISKYFCGLYGDVIPLDLKTDFGDTIITKISSRPITRLNRQKIGVAFQYFDAQIKFKLPIDFFYRIENSLTEQQIFNINRYMENVFDSDLLSFIYIGVCLGMEKRTVTEAFLNKFDIVIDDDITYDSIRQKDSRMRKNPTMKNNFLVTLSQSNASLKLRA